MGLFFLSFCNSFTLLANKYLLTYLVALLLTYLFGFAQFMQASWFVRGASLVFDLWQESSGFCLSSFRALVGGSNHFLHSSV